tara:strand:+ start:582 stop:821 length:240 start_codon:yes stop_codon:yes gene_type:complete
LLRSSRVGIKIDDSWSDAKKKLDGHRGYDGWDDEKMKETLFEEYIAKWEKKEAERSGDRSSRKRKADDSPESSKRRRKE